ncbi:hypothetical protein TruAng_007476 [Truncatella angustata]|nr:hypothetical protein TruAng_007476 [Truncatella angustata]
MASKYLTVVLASAASASIATWGQCGGTGYTGETTCVSGAVCTTYNPYYAQCVPGSATSAATSSSSRAATTTTSNAATTSSSITKATSATATTTVPTKGGSTSSTAPTSTATSGTRYFITFGDSYSQTGFDINGTHPSAANPLGNPTLPGYTASGGLDWVGYMVTEHNSSLLLSYNLAYGGATTDANLVTPYASTVLSFVDQVNEFSTSLASKPSWAPWTAENTLVGAWLGVNDVGNTFWLSNMTEVIDAVTTRYFELLQVTYNAGARNFVLLAVPPTDQTPLMLANDASSEASLVSAISTYNNFLSTKLATFKSNNSGVTAWLVNTTVPFMEAINNPTAYGAPNATCYNSDGVSCLWFNDYHPGVKIQGLVADTVATTVGAPWFTS